MTRKKLKLAYIENASKRNVSFRKRTRGLLNKVKEINTLCDVDACAIIYGPNETEPHVWPSMEGVLAVMDHFYALPHSDRTNKMVNHNGFTQMRSNKIREQIGRLQRENKRIEAETFVYKCRVGVTRVDQVGMSYKDEMGWVIDQMIMDLKSVIDARGGGGTTADAVTPTSEMAAPGVGLHQVPSLISGVASAGALLVDLEIWESVLPGIETLFLSDMD